MKKLLGALSAGLIVAAIAALVITNPFTAGGDFTDQTKLSAELSSTNVDPLASGKTKWEQRLQGVVVERQRTSTEVEDVSTTGAHEVRIIRGTTLIQSMTVNVDALGFGDLNLDSRPPTSDTVEVFQVNDTVEVRNPSGDVILTGTLQQK